MTDLLEIGGHAVTFTEHPDVLVTAECEGLTISWLKGDMSEEEAIEQKRKAAEHLVRDVVALRAAK